MLPSVSSETIPVRYIVRAYPHRTLPAPRDFLCSSFVEEPEDFPFVGADEIVARQHRIDDLNPLSFSTARTDQLHHWLDRFLNDGAFQFRNFLSPAS